jgi:hypothetical protein
MGQEKEEMKNKQMKKKKEEGVIGIRVMKSHESADQKM